MEEVELHIEAVLFASADRVTVKELAEILLFVFERNFEETEVEESLTKITEKFDSNHSSFQLKKIDAGYQFFTKPDYQKGIQYLQQQRSKKKLSVSAMETLAIISYKQPITKSEIEQIRGVNCDYSVHKLLEKELISIEGKSDAPGKPLLYVTSKMFMDYFSLNSIADLPKLKDIATQPDSTIGENDFQ